MSIQVKNITKKYGSQSALSNVSFTVKKGEIVGFLGPNGAGKSTMMKLITGYISPTSGAVLVNGLKASEKAIEVKRQIGYLPEHNPLYLDMYVREYLSFCASIYNLDNKVIDATIKKVKLTPEAHKKIGALSKGYRQRVGLAAAMLHNPEVLILDEPTTGLDPNQIVEIRNLIKEIGADKTVLFSTHIMQEVEAICDRVIIINNGKILADERLQELTKTENQIIEVEFDYKIEQEFLEQIPNLKTCTTIFDTTWELVFDTQKDMRPAIFDFAQHNGLKILQLNKKSKNLETLFRDLTT
ncbi:MAG TPA: gliding motility-associated ABC transporter ATP-binding subunit GldA [Flavobacteriaceae bacterium]|nr:gliding motility-associated ABC transporter ATP-binding subunit GldA [Flavobacteriaceae bacterium]